MIFEISNTQDKKNIIIAFESFIRGTRIRNHAHHVDIIRTLLSRMQILVSSQNEFKQYIELLLENGADVECFNQTEYMKETPLINVAKRGALDVFLYLIHNRPELMSPEHLNPALMGTTINFKGTDPLSIGLRFNNPRAIRHYLLDMNVPIVDINYSHGKLLCMEIFSLYKEISMK